MPAPPPRRHDIELLRVLAAFGIVWFHIRSQGSALAYGGLAAFLVLSVQLGGRSGRPDAATLRRRAQRLLLPWAAWFAAYALLNVARGGNALDLRHGWACALLAGPSIHLWYLPYIFGVLVGLDLLRAHFAAATLAWAGALLALALTAGAPWWRPISLGLPYPALQWCDAAAPVAAGLFLAQADALPRTARRALALALPACALAVAPWQAIGQTYALGFAACVAVASGRGAGWRLPGIERLSQLTFGIYLAHIMVLIGLLTHARLTEPQLPWATFAVAALAVALLRALLPRVARAVT